MVIHPNTHPAAHCRESNSQPVDHKSDALNRCFQRFLWNGTLFSNFYCSPNEPMGVARNLSWGTREGRHSRLKAKSGEGFLGEGQRATESGGTW